MNDSNKSSVLITGANGFIGNRLLLSLINQGVNAVGAVRDLNVSTPNFIQSPSLSVDADWRELLVNKDVVIHLAGRAHVLKETIDNPLALFREVNVDGTIKLAKQAIQAGVKRFVFISSIGVNGNSTTTTPFSAEDEPNPVEPYALSKYEAEQALRKLSFESGMELVIIRPPLVYGADAPGNFGKLINLVCKGYPLPLGAVNNKRSFVSVNNLISLITTCINHPNAANQLFLVSDDEDISTTDLLSRVNKILKIRSRLVPVPVFLLYLIAQIVGKKDVINKLCCSLQVNIGKTKSLLDWVPSESVEQGLCQVVRGFNHEKTI